MSAQTETQIETAPTAAEIVASAWALVPFLREQAAQCEAERRVSESDDRPPDAGRSLQCREAAPIWRLRDGLGRLQRSGGRDCVGLRLDRLGLFGGRRACAGGRALRHRPHGRAMERQSRRSDLFLPMGRRRDRGRRWRLSRKRRRRLQQRLPQRRLGDRRRRPDRRAEPLHHPRAADRRCRSPRHLESDRTRRHGLARHSLRRRLHSRTPNLASRQEAARRDARWPALPHRFPGRTLRTTFGRAWDRRCGS